MNKNIQTDLKLIDKDVVACDGRDWSDGHPRVFLDISKGKEVNCPYCSQRYIKK
ncbi:MAG: zinc-finger domain-containing protein [Rickettsiales bacterium TMED254]|nr:zinc-finger domain-containing protein [Rickettsiales bacterium]RPF76429.1 MAG: zinc-finger domain-containing protein [Rickettsiales bacterium TMED254]|tara:strand:- start:615 stop:776 length:162 start_codon:yes stop_codon:yes gene_type:complete